MPVISKFKSLIKKIKNKIPISTRQDNDAIYRLLYHYVHDNEKSLSLAFLQTKNAFAHQWDHLSTGSALLSDEWFLNNVCRILSQEEIQISPEWFAEKEILDAGCGNGRWSFGFAKLGANVTAVDINQVALDETKEHLKDFSVQKEFIQSPLENLKEALEGRQFDMVFSWGVLHHCESFNKALDELVGCVKEGGVLYLYLYGRETHDFDQDLNLFKERVHYNTLFSEQERMQFLLKKSRGDKNRLHISHDIYAPMINRRFEFDFIKKAIEKRGLHSVERTIEHPELFIRALKGNCDSVKLQMLPKKKKPFWFERYQ